MFVSGFLPLQICILVLHWWDLGGDFGRPQRLSEWLEIYADGMACLLIRFGANVQMDVFALNGSLGLHINVCLCTYDYVLYQIHNILNGKSRETFHIFCTKSVVVMYNKPSQTLPSNPWR